jgi:DNA-binding transcriptional ArsR family regulator
MSEETIGDDESMREDVDEDVVESGGPPVRPRDMKQDPKAMRALAHPVRVAIMEELVLAHELTATGAAELVGESPANCSFHLRQLAKYGFVEESGTGQGRNRPWRLSNLSMELDSVGAEAEPEAAGAMDALGSLFFERAVERARAWTRRRSTFPPAWRRVANSKQAIWWVTAEELAELDAEVNQLLYRYYERAADPQLRPAGALPVEFVSFAHPLRSPPAEDGSPAAAKKGEE